MGMRNESTSTSDATELREPAESAVELEPGTLLSGRFLMGELLGKGGMASVYAARDMLKGRDIAIKLLPPELNRNADFRERFMAEANVSCDLSHPNIVRVYDVGLSGQHLYLSMERLHGQTLRHYLRAQTQSRVPLDVATHIARQMIEALQYAQSRIVHRDIKPENTWRCEDGTIKLTDFGIARSLLTHDPAQHGLTKTWMVMGTPDYMAPEQRLSTKYVDWRADQYSLGVVLYELLTGTVPRGVFKPLDVLRRDVPKRYARAVMRALSGSPEERWPSWAALLAELTVPARRQARWAVAAGLLILSAAAAGTVVYWNHERATPAQSAEVSTTARQDEAKILAPEVPVKAASTVRDASTALEVSPKAGAPSLGELKLSSVVNQPFAAEIELVVPTSYELAGLKVALANNEAFARYGLERPAYLSDFKFAVARNADGGAAIKITSSKAVSEPFVTLLVEVLSDQSRLLREYTVLLDSPAPLPSQAKNAAPITPKVAGKAPAAPRDASKASAADAKAGGPAAGDFILGDLVLNSALNQPFNADIEVRIPASYDLAQLKVTLASDAAFTRAGVKRPAYLSDFKFAVTRSRDGRPVVKVTSSKPVTDSVVNLLMDVASGQDSRGARVTITLAPSVSKPQPKKAHSEGVAVSPATREFIANLVHPPLSTFRDRLNDGSDGPVMVVIPGGEFLMGSPDSEVGRLAEEGPAHLVTVGRFALGRTEVTFEEYDRFATATRRERPKDRGWGRGMRPVISVRWSDATAYAEWLSRKTGKSYRLPTEAEWEYAARADTQTPFYTGICISGAQANFDDRAGYTYAGCPASNQYRGQTLPVGQFPANAFGLHDMHGNVWEWVQDCTHANYDHAPADGREWRENSCSRRVVRGGSWDFSPQHLRSAFRDRYAVDVPISNVGFRLARTL